MRNSVKTLLALVIVAATLSACGVYEPCSPGDRIDITELEEAAKKDHLEATWGEPVKRLETEDGRVDVYSFMSDRGCLLVIWALVPYPIPTDLPTTGHFTVAYGADGSFKQIRVWHNANSPGEAVDLYLQSLAEEEAQLAEEEAQAEAKRLADQKARAKELARLGPICEIPFVEAEQLDEKAISDRFLTCRKGKYLSLWNRMMWGCLVANSNHVGAQNWMGLQYEERYHALGLTSDLLESYKWYGIAIEQDLGGYDHRGRIVYLMSQSELTKAKQMARDWHPNPSECEALSQAAEGSTQPN